jgi:hypothetical protein
MPPASSATSAESSCRWTSRCARSAVIWCRQRLRKRCERQHLRCLRHPFHRRRLHRRKFRAPLSLRNRVEAGCGVRSKSGAGGRSQSRSSPTEEVRRNPPPAPESQLRPSPNKVPHLKRQSRALENPPNSSQKVSPTESARNPAKSTTTPKNSLPSSPKRVANPRRLKQTAESEHSHHCAMDLTRIRNASRKDVERIAHAVVDAAKEWLEKPAYEKGESLGRATTAIASEVAIDVLTEGIGSVATLRKVGKVAEAADHVRDAEKGAAVRSRWMSLGNTKCARSVAGKMIRSNPPTRAMVAEPMPRASRPHAPAGSESRNSR